MRQESKADRLILEAATGARRLSRAELRRVIEHVAQAGFHPEARVEAGRWLAGIHWRGRMLKRGDRLTPVEQHYLKHAAAKREWPADTTLENYLDSIREVVLDRRSGVLASRYHGSWQLTVVRRSGNLKGPDGFEWVLVDYRLGLGHWVTAYQPREGLRVLRSASREDVRWLRRPK